MQQSSSNFVLNSLKFNQRKGELSYKGIRYLLIRPETIIGIQKNIKQAEKAFFKGGFEGGSRTAEKLADSGLKLKEIVESMCKMGTCLGWGKLELVNFNKKSFSIKVTSSPFALSFGKSRKPVCHLIRGVFAGVGKIIFKKNVSAKELKCTAQANRFCVFVIQ